MVLGAAGAHALRHPASSAPVRCIEQRGRPVRQPLAVTCRQQRRRQPPQPHAHRPSEGSLLSSHQQDGSRVPPAAAASTKGLAPCQDNSNNGFSLLDGSSSRIAGSGSSTPAAGPGCGCQPGAAATHCSLCDLSTKDAERDADWTDLVATMFRASKHDSAIFSLALPAVLALAADPLLSMVDTIFVGQAGADSLAALGVNSALFTFAFLVFNFLATATTPMVASSLATGDSEKAGKVTLQALLLATVLGGVLAGSLVVFSEGALALMGAGPETGHVHELAAQFLTIRALAAPAALLMTVGQGAFRGLQDMRTPLAITLAANGINLALDTVLILGMGWGVSGAAVATTTAEWVAALAYLGILWQRRDALGGLSPRLVLGARLAEAVEEMAPFLRAGGAMLMRTALLLGTKTLASATAARLGVVPIAAHQVVGQLWLLSSLIVDSVAIAGQTLVAVQLGRQDVQEARAVGNRLLGLGIGTGVLLGGAFWLAEPVIPGIFSSDAEVQAAVHEILPIAVAMLPINAAVYAYDGIFTGAADFKFMAGAMVLAAGTAVALLVGVEPLGLGLPGVWYALGLLMVSRLGTMIWRYQSEDGPLPPSAGRLLGQADPVLPAPAAASKEQEVAGRGSSSSSKAAPLQRLNGSAGSSSAGNVATSASFASSADVVGELSNNAVESPLPQKGSAWREAGSARRR